MKYSWSKTVIPIAAIFSFRMLGLFMLIPVFTILSGHLEHATPSLVGIALGSYGLSQGLLQIPFGMLSDKYGRKPIITLGLILFALGSLIGAFSHSIYTLIIARILQGTGAIGSVLIALLADLTPDRQRTQAMAVIGLSIGLSFSLAMVVSPIVGNYFGLPGIFYLTAILAFLGLILLHGIIPTPIKESFHLDTEVKPALLKKVLRNKNLQHLNVSIFLQHFILTSTFYAVPLLLVNHIKQGHLSQQWHFYLPLMLFSFIAMLPFIFIAEKRKQQKAVFLLSLCLTGIAQLLLSLISESWFSFCTALFVYFVSFNILEANLPSLISKQAEINSKGTAMGVYSSCQFLGIFVGGLLAGLLYASVDIAGIFIVNALIAVIWLLISLGMKPNLYQSTLILPCEKNFDENLNFKLRDLQGVNEVHYLKQKKLVYLRIDKEKYIDGSAEAIINK